MWALVIYGCDRGPRSISLGAATFGKRSILDDLQLALPNKGIIFSKHSKSDSNLESWN
jgi:hypothetical protein